MNFWISHQWILILFLWYYLALGLRQRLVGIAAIRINILCGILGYIFWLWEIGVCLTSSTCNFQSMKSRVELNGLSLKFFCCVTCFNERRTVNWILSTQKFVNQNSFDERFPCVNTRLPKLSYVKIFQDQCQCCSVVNAEICTLSCAMLMCFYLKHQGE